MLPRVGKLLRTRAHECANPQVTPAGSNDCSGNAAVPLIRALRPVILLNLTLGYFEQEIKGDYHRPAEAPSFLEGPVVLSTPFWRLSAPHSLRPLPGPRLSGSPGDTSHRLLGPHWGWGGTETSTLVLPCDGEFHVQVDGAWSPPLLAVPLSGLKPKAGPSIGARAQPRPPPAATSPGAALEPLPPLPSPLFKSEQTSQEPDKNCSL